MQKQNGSVMHRILKGWEFYPITYKEQRYVITIKIGFGGWFYVNIYKYTSESTSSKKHKGEKVLSKQRYACFTYSEPGERGFSVVPSIFSSEFTNNYPLILKDIFQDYEEKLRKEKRNVKWDGVIE